MGEEGASCPIGALQWRAELVGASGSWWGLQGAGGSWWGAGGSWRELHVPEKKTIAKRRKIYVGFKRTLPAVKLAKTP